MKYFEDAVMMISGVGRVDGEVPTVFLGGEGGIWRRHTMPEILKNTKWYQTKFMCQY